MSMEITFEMPNKAINISANYEHITHKISASAGANGKISKSGSVLVKEGYDYTFTFTPNKGYKVKDVLVNGVSVGAVESYTFEKVTQEATISVEFEKIGSAPQNNQSGGSSGCGIYPLGGKPAFKNRKHLAVWYIRYTGNMPHIVSII